MLAADAISTFHQSPRQAVTAASRQQEDPQQGTKTHAGAETSRQSADEAKSPSGQQLSDQEKKQLDELKARDREVRAHEAAHQAAAGGYARVGRVFPTNEALTESSMPSVARCRSIPRRFPATRRRRCARPRSFVALPWRLPNPRPRIGPLPPRLPPWRPRRGRMLPSNPVKTLGWIGACEIVGQCRRISRC